MQRLLIDAQWKRVSEKYAHAFRHPRATHPTLPIAFVAVFTLMALIAPDAHAADYYVAQNGSDSNPGTQTSPWRTIGYVNGRTFVAGDRILFRRGDKWREQITAAWSGNSTSPITFSAYGTASTPPKIVGADQVTTWTLDQVNSNGVKVWRASLPSGSAAVRPYVVTRNDIWANENTGGPGVLNDLQWYWNDTTKILYLANNTGDPNTMTIEAGQRDNCFYENGKSYLKIDGLWLEKANSGTVLFNSGSHNTIQNSTLRYSNSRAVGGAGVHISVSHFAQVLSCNLNGLRGDGIYVNKSTDVTIADNTIATVWKGINPSGDSIQFGGGSATQRNDRFRITGNTCTQRGTNTPKGCIIVEFGNDGYIAENVCSYGNFGIEYSGNGSVIERNTCRYQGVQSGQNWAAGLYSSLQEGGNLQDNIWRYNVVYGCKNGIYILSDGPDTDTDGSGPDTDSDVNTYTRTNYKFYNNTIYDCSQYGVQITTPISGEFRNNIVWCPNAQWQVCRIDKIIANDNNNWTTTNNLLGPERTGYNLVRFKLTTYAATLAQAQTIYPTGSAPFGFEQYSKKSDPLFINPFIDSGDPDNLPDFHLSSSSPAIDSGSNLHSSSVKDRDGNSIYYGVRTDIGAYEYGY
jgi:hypothetical protein